jgi:hypothetical protein
MLTQDLDDTVKCLHMSNHGRILGWNFTEAIDSFFFLYKILTFCVVSTLIWQISHK